MSSEPLKVAVVGLGRWGNTLASAIQKTQDMKIVNCFTLTPEKRKAFTEKFGCGEEETYEALVKNPEVDAVVISAPNNKHSELAIAAAREGKHVFVDKPIAASLSDAKAMIKTCDDAGVILAVGASSRRLRGHRLFKKLIDEGVLGTIALAETNYSNDRGLYYTPENWQ
jgi:predicted dehydrogenase